MTFFKRKRKSNQLCVVETEIISSYDDGTGCGPRYVTRFFLAKKRKNKYYELFSGEPLKLKEDCHHNGVYSANFDVPYIVQVESIIKYSDKKEFTDSELFMFITKMNTLNELGAFDEDDEIDEDFEEEMSEE